MVNEETAYLAKIGELAVSFAKLEYDLGYFLQVLVDRDSLIIGPFFIDRMRLRDLLNKIQQISKYRLEDEPELLKNIKETIKDIHKIREERNLLIHGVWDIERNHVLGFKIRFENGCWQHIVEKTTTPTKIDSLIRKCVEFSKKVQCWLEKFESKSLKLCPNRFGVTSE